LYPDKRHEPTVVTYRELIVLTGAIMLLMWLLFPRHMIEEAIENEKSNYDLTLIYLKSIASAYPDNPRNWLRLLDAQLKMGRTEEAEAIFGKLSRMHAITADQTRELAYRLLKNRYLHAGGSEKKRMRRMLRERMKALLESDDPALWYSVAEDAQRLQMPDLAFDAWRKRLLHATVIDPSEVEKAFWLGVANHREAEATALAEAALARDPDPRTLKLLVDRYHGKARYDRAAALLARYYEISGQPNYLFDAAQNYLWAKEKHRAIALLQRHEAALLHDRQLSERLIRFYLANGALKAAHAFTLRVLKSQKVLP